MAPKGAGESDEEYKQRLISTGQTLFNESSTQDQAESDQLYRCKKYLKAFLSDAGKISTTANKLTADERFEFNKYNAPITKKYIDTYGFNNKDITEQEIVDFIRDTLATKNFTLASTQAGAQVVAQKPAPEPPEPPLAITAKEALLQFSRDNNLRPRATSTVPELCIELEDAGFHIPKGIIRIMRRGDVETVNRHYAHLGGNPVLVGTGSHQKPLPKESYYGLGANYEHLPANAPFGDYFISPHNLFYKNILSVRGRTKKPVNGYKDIRVSDALVSILMNIIKGHTVRKHELASLSEHEHIIYDDLIKLAKLHKHHHNTIDKTIEKMKERFQILEGELDAGNNNDLIYKELNSLIYKMAHIGVISQNEAKRYLKELRNK
jgi:hypothetical protein